LIGHAAAVDANQPTAPTHQETPAAVRGNLLENYGKLSLYFEENHGQTDPAVKFLAHGNGYQVFLTGEEAVISLAKTASPIGRRPRLAPKLSEIAVVRLKPLGATAASRISGSDELAGKTNYFIGNDSRHWRTGIPNYARVTYHEVYPGVDMVYYGNQRQLEYDFIIAPGSNPAEITLGIETEEFQPGRSVQQKSLAIDPAGDLLVHTSAGDLRFLRPRVYQPAASSGPLDARVLEGNYVLRGINRIGFELKNYDRSRPVVIDPVLAYSTYLGGSGNDGAYGIAVDSLGRAVVTGSTSSANFPLTGGIVQTSLRGPSDAFVTQFDPTGTSLVFSTYVGGSNDDFGVSVALDNSGNPYVIGITTSPNFPFTTGAFQTTLRGGRSAFVTKLSSNGSSLRYSTFLAGSSGSDGAGIAVDTSGNAYVSGSTHSSDFPVTAGVVQHSFGGGTCGTGANARPCNDAFVTKINPTGKGLVFSTFLGGADDDGANGIAIDTSGNVYVTGYATSTNFPLANPFETYFHGGAASCSDFVCGDAFVTRLNPTATTLIYSTYLGGAGEDSGIGIAADNAGNAYVTGGTASSDFPVSSHAFQTRFGGGSTVCASVGTACGDAFAAGFTPSGTLRYATYLGGSGDDVALFGVAVDSHGNAYLTGVTNSNNFPVTANTAVKPSFSGGSSVASCGVGSLCGDAFVAAITPSGGLLYSSYLGGSSDDGGFGLAMDSSRNLYVAGITASSDFPRQRPFQSVIGGGSDAFVAKISLKVGFGDFDGDGKSDLTVWRPSTGVWYSLLSRRSYSQSIGQAWGTNGDVPLLGDFDGDGLEDFGIWRPSVGTWFVSLSSNPATHLSQQWGTVGDQAVPADYDGDGITDYAVFRPSIGVWYILSSKNPGTIITTQWGTSGDIPVPADYDGDGKADLAVFRPSTGFWYIIPSANPSSFIAQNWGTAGDIPVPGDYDNDHKTDVAVWRPSEGRWYVRLSSNSTNVSQPWGTSSDIPVPADYDGDGKTDYAVWRPSEGNWYIIPSSNPSSFKLVTWGIGTDKVLTKAIGQ
jgi:hypothetical protein